MSLFTQLEQFGSRTALHIGVGEHVTYRQLAGVSDSLSDGLAPRSLILCLAETSRDFVCGYVGFIRNQHVVLVLPSTTPQANLEKFIAAYRPNYVWTPENLLSALPEMSTKSLGKYVLRKISQEPLVMHQELALLVPTSGTTGSPTVVRQSIQNITSNASSISHSLDLNQDDCAITTLPLNYVYGLSILHSQFHQGGSVAISNSNVLSRNFWDRLREFPVTYFGGVPYTYEMIIRLGMEVFSKTQVRFLTQAGGRLPDDLRDSLFFATQRIGIDFLVMYGQTEATSRISVLQAKDYETRRGSVGQAIRDGKVRLKSAPSADQEYFLPESEIEYSGPNVTMGYAESFGDLAKGFEFGEYLGTGDLGTIDDQGFIYIAGRKKRITKLYGHRISLDDIEKFIETMNHKAVCIDCGDRLGVFVNEESSIEAVRRGTAEFLDVRPSAISVQYVDRFPRNDAGKIQYAELLKLVDST